MPFAIFKKETDAARERERREVLQGLHSAGADLKAARLRFNNATQPELVEASVYEINAQQARYAYYLRLARERDITVRGNRERLVL
jgi:UDP-glucose 6-dehydrogenase